MSSAGEAAPSKNKGENTIWKVSATIANKRAVRMRGPAEIVMVPGFIYCDFVNYLAGELIHASGVSIDPLSVLCK